ncbi:MAG: hypothetical protein HOQ24_14945, partial [Mycobacteriaceae bacterium]|nr:hypothetical protein [Mycobacteriaceae bacterium]
AVVAFGGDDTEDPKPTQAVAADVSTATTTPADPAAVAGSADIVAITAAMPPVLRKAVGNSCKAADAVEAQPSGTKNVSCVVAPSDQLVRGLITSGTSVQVGSWIEPSPGGYEQQWRREDASAVSRRDSGYARVQQFGSGYTTVTYIDNVGGLFVKASGFKDQASALEFLTRCSL